VDGPCGQIRREVPQRQFVACLENEMIDYLFNQLAPVGVFFLVAAAVWLATAALSKRGSDQWSPTSALIAGSLLVVLMLYESETHENNTNKTARPKSREYIYPKTSERTDERDHRRSTC